MAAESSAWGGNRVNIYINQEAKERIEEIRPHLEQEYEGPSDFFKTKLKQEEPLDLEEKIEEKEREKVELEADIQELKKRKKAQNQERRLKELEGDLKEKQESLEEAKEDDRRSRDEIIEDIKEKHRQSGREIDDELMDKIEANADRKISRRPNLDELSQEISEIQEEIMELDPDREEKPEWFLEV